MNRHDAAPDSHFRNVTKVVAIGSKRPVAETSRLIAGCVEKGFEPYWWALGVGNGA